MGWPRSAPSGRHESVRPVHAFPPDEDVATLFGTRDRAVCAAATAPEAVEGGALERIARNSEVDRSPIGEMLAAFVRTHAPWPAGDRDHADPHPTPVVDETMLWLRDRAPDVQAAMVVL